ncbi:MAG: glucokinase [Parcubacteria group bacterium Gr01-1014_48]|nr:MAG: glucokinase [Parcubacteria group bacterium Greene0416_14]TSC74593.1 MAG: glucokinase [Parcubacteria group bacterium Gr01-1014_48]TSD01608.1 MAG: glucokinase [Parcubacteria group bacterium Greene1014_15]TSD08343.1 MAG: glucokinase [Parcubacteria group bacterium Greene0714_4]
MYILFDIGGTNIRVAASPDGSTYGEPITFSTPEKFDEGIERIVDAANILRSGIAVSASAGGVKGPVNPKEGVLLHPPNLPNWKDKPLKERLEKEFSAPVFVDNDTAIVGLGEAVAGGGKGHAIVAYVTVSTGANGVRIVDGKLDRNAYGFEIGHHIINWNEKTQCTCSDTPTWQHPEAFITGSAFERRFVKKPYEITDEKIWDESARILAVVLHNVIMFWSPECIVIGGSMIIGTNGPVIPLDRAQTYLQHMVTIFPKIPKIVPAELGAFGGLHGALALIRSKLEEIV